MPPLKTDSTVTYGQLIKYTFMMFSVLVILLGAVVGYALQEGNQNGGIIKNFENLERMEKVVDKLVTITNKHNTDIEVIKEKIGI